MESKPGYKTTEFWLSLAAMILGAVFAAGIVPDDSGIAKVLGIAASVLGALGYSVSRAFVKSSEVKAQALASAVNPSNPPKP